MISNLNEFNFRLRGKDNEVIEFKTYPRITLTFEKVKSETNESKILQTLDRILKVTELSALSKYFASQS